MSYFNFLATGASGKQAEWRRDQYPQDKIENVGSTHQFKGEVVTTATTDKTKEVLIDQAVKVTTIADEAREKAKSFWASMKNACYGTFTATLITGIAAGAAALALGAALPFLWPVALAVGVCALAIIGFAIWNGCRGAQAKSELAKWDNDPIHQYRQNRINAEEKGFYFAYNSNFKGSFVSREELEGLWFQEMDRWADRFLTEVTTESGKVSNTRGFISKCPLGTRAMDYAFENEPSVEAQEYQFLRDLSGQCASIETQYRNVRENTENLRRGIQQEKNRSLSQNNQWLEQELAPYKTMILVSKAPLESEKARLQRVIDRHNIYVARQGHHRTSVHVPARQPTRTRHGHVVPGQGRAYPSRVRGYQQRPATTVTTVVVPYEVEAAQTQIAIINRSLAKLDTVFQAMTAPIHRVHASNATRINSWAASEMRKIQAAEDDSVVKFHPPLQAIMAAYRNRHQENVQIEELEPNIDLDVDLHAPELDEEFEPPAFNEEWKEFVCEVDWERGIKRETTTIRAGSSRSTTTQISGL